jgi:hypothetical protein
VCFVGGGGSHQFGIVGSSLLQGLNVTSLSAFDGSTKLLMHELELYFIVNMKEKLIIQDLSTLLRASSLVKITIVEQV